MLTVSFPLLVFLGIVLGYVFNRTVLAILSALLVLFYVPSLLGFFSHEGLAQAIAFGVAYLGLCLLVPMWITHFVKQAGGITTCLKWLKDKTVDVEKKAD